MRDCDVGSRKQSRRTSRPSDANAALVKGLRLKSVSRARNRIGGTVENVVVIEARGTLRLVELEGLNLRCLQDLVGGMIERLDFPGLGLHGYMNENARGSGLLPNRLASDLWRWSLPPDLGVQHDVLLDCEAEPNADLVGPVVMLGGLVTDLGVGYPERGLTDEELDGLVGAVIDRGIYGVI